MAGLAHASDTFQPISSHLNRAGGQEYGENNSASSLRAIEQGREIPAVFNQTTSFGNANKQPLTETRFAGEAGELGGRSGGGLGGNGGVSVIGGMSAGLAGGDMYQGASPEGSSANSISDNHVNLTNVTLDGNGASGGQGGDVYTYGGGGAAGSGGGAVFGGMSFGGAGGVAELTTTAFASGGAAGSITNNRINLTNVSLNADGAAGGSGGGILASFYQSYGGGGAAGHGGGSVFGGASVGGAGGHASSYPSGGNFTATADGGVGGDVSSNSIALTDVRLNGRNALGGQGGTTALHAYSFGGGGAAGHGGGSVFGGVSTGGAGGYAAYGVASANGGAGGNVSNNSLALTNVVLDGTAAAGGAGGNSSANGGAGAKGYDGGSVFGGISTGGAGGYAASASATANGGDGGNVRYNDIIVSGVSSFSGSLYGGISQGGAAGITHNMNNVTASGEIGYGGLTSNNTITLIGDQLSIGGAVYGGWSANGDGALNTDAGFNSYYAGNTLNLRGYRGTVQGIYHFENYNWVLPKDVVNQDTLISISGADKVALDNTKHTIAMENDGNRLLQGDVVVLIDKVQGELILTTPQIQQGHFITYDAKLQVEADRLMLSFDERENNSSDSSPLPAGRITPTAKAFLGGRLASLAQVNQGADAISDIGMATARESLGRCGTNLFMFADGGSNRYDSDVRIKLRGVNFGLGAATCFNLPSKSTAMLGAFIEHGNSNFDSDNSFSEYADVHGWGKARYTGVGVLLHMNVAGTSYNTKENAAPSIAKNDGLYLNAALRAGRAKTRFHSSDLVDPEGLAGQYNAKSNYFSVMAGAGYALQLDEKQTWDFYGRYTWSHLGSDDVQVGKDWLNLRSSDSSRLRLGVRYNYAVTPQVTPYVGLGYERAFNGRAKGSAYGMDIDAPNLKGNTGIAELGLTVVPAATKQALSVNFGVKGYFSDREGAAAHLRLRYAF